MSNFDIGQILEHIPHRYPFLLIDRVIEYKKDTSLTALKNVTINEPFFQGHFPHLAVMPGVLVIEAMAQSTGILAFRSLGLARLEVPAWVDDAPLVAKSPFPTIWRS